jgi:glucokinase
MAPLPVQDELSSRLRAYLERVTGFADVESALSGAGVVRIYDFLRDEHVGVESATLREDLRRGERAAVITDHALLGKDPLCVKTLDLFVSVYGAEAAALAVVALATGGVYLAGGIAPRIVRKLRDGTFVKAFVANPRMRRVLEMIPVFVVMDEDVGLRGAAVVAKGV